MKKSKILSFVLAILLLVCLVGCGGNKNDDKEALANAGSIVDSMYKDGSQQTPADYTLINKVVVDGKEFTVDWEIEVKSGNADDVKGQAGSDAYHVDVNEKASAEVKYTIKATITSPSKNTLTKSYDRVVPAFQVNTWEEYKAAENDKLLTVKGVITGLIASSRGNSTNALYLQDEVGGYYVYGMKQDPVTDLNLKVGMEITATALKSLYNGTYELVGNTSLDIAVEVVNSEVKEVTPVDYTDLFNKAADTKDAELVDKQGLLVTIKGVELTTIDESNGYLNFTLNGKSSYVRISSSVCPLVKDDQAALKAKFVKGSVVDVTGVICVYNGAFYLTPVTVDAIKESDIKLSDAEIVERAKEAVEALADQVYASDLDLFTSTGLGATVTWESSNPDLIANDGTLGAYPAEETEVTLTATITSGDVSEKVSIKVKVAALSQSPISEVLPLCDGENAGKNVLIVGKVVSADSDGYIFVADESGVIYVRTKLPEGISVGDTVKVIGTTTNYTNNDKQYTRQINSNAEITKVDDAVTPDQSVYISIADLATAPQNAEEVIANKLYGRMVTVTGYVQTRGSYGNVYICASEAEDSPAILYYYKSTNQDELKALVGKQVTITAPVYSGHFTDGWQLGSYTNLVEGEAEMADFVGGMTVEEVHAAEIDAEVTIAGKVVYIYDGNGFVLSDGTNAIYVYNKGGELVAGLKVGNDVVVKGTRGNYNGPQIALTSVALRSTAEGYEWASEAKTLAEISALGGEDLKNYGKAYKVTGTLVASGNYINIQSGEVVYNLYLTNDQKDAVRSLVDKEVELVVITYQFNTKSNTFSFFALVDTVSEKAA